MEHIKSFKPIEDNLHELTVTAGEDIPPGYLLTLSKEKFILVEEQTDIELDGELYDIYYFTQIN